MTKQRFNTKRHITQYAFGMGSSRYVDKRIDEK
jgi:hypothetical protein